jgi:hypothetical protein
MHFEISFSYLAHMSHVEPSLPRSFVITPSHAHRKVWREEPFASMSLTHFDATISCTALILDLLGTTEQTRPPRGDETGLLTLDGVPRDGRSLTDMLVVTTTVGMVDGVHGNTTSPGPAVALGGELGVVSTVSSRQNHEADLMLSARRLHEGFVCATTSGDDADHTTA